MLQSMRTWLQAAALRDPIERGQAVVFQVILLILIGISSLITLLTTTIVLTTGLQNQVAWFAAMLMLVSSCSALWLVRRGIFGLGVSMATVGFTLANSLTLFGSGMPAGGGVAIIGILPLVLAGMLAQRRALLLTAGVIVGSLLLVEVLQAVGSPLVGFALPPGMVEPSIGPPFIAVVVVVTFFFAIFGSALQQALHAALARERDLEALRATLEQTVEQRTAELRSALAEVHTHAAEQARLLDEVAIQRELIRELSVPILPVDASTVIVPLVGALDVARLADLQARILQAVATEQATTVLLDVTGVPLIDTAIGHHLIELEQALRLMGAEMVLIGVRPDVAQTIIGLGIDLVRVRTASDMRRALAERRAYQP